ncbi:peroxiredoxin type-2 [Paramyrothecium foliicola]|nr:peroxiredoxin type-2 [Paramyrothecium foliicola]
MCDGCGSGGIGMRQKCSGPHKNDGDAEEFQIIRPRHGFRHLEGQDSREAGARPPASPNSGGPRLREVHETRQAHQLHSFSKGFFPAVKRLLLRHTAGLFHNPARLGENCSVTNRVGTNTIACTVSITSLPSKSQPLDLHHHHHQQSCTVQNNILTMSELKVGDSFPEGVVFQYIPYSAETGEVTACGIPQKFDASQEFKNKKVALISVPGAFTPTCQVAHIPSFILNKQRLQEKGIDQVVVIAYNDPFVMSAWGKANAIQDDYIIFATDPEVKFSKGLGWLKGERTARYAIVIDHGKVVYAAKEDGPGIDVSGAEPILAAL